MTRIQIFSNTILIATMEGNTDVQLREGKDGFYMTSPKTGNHILHEPSLNERVLAHWEGFKANQNI